MEENTAKKSSHLLETMMEEILARLPLKSIARFKSVSKKWKSTFESPYFRRLFLSVHKDSSSSWSLLYGAEEVIGFHGCETWDLPKPPASFIPHSFKRYHIGEFHYRASSNGLVLIEDCDHVCYVGNPVLQQWVNISSPPNDGTAFGLVTRVDEYDIVSSFKVFSLASVQTSNDCLTQSLSVFLYSSETGVWTSRNIHCAHQITNLSYITANGTIYFSCLSEPARLVAHDFYSDSDQFRVVHFPDHSDINNIYKRVLTTSGGFVMYIRTSSHMEAKTVFNVWRLNNDDTWQLLWEEIGISIIGNYAPMVMDPFDSGVVYLWSIHDRHVVSCDLRRQSYKILRIGCNGDHQDFFIDQSVCDKSLHELWGSGSLPDWDYFRVLIWLFQFVLPRWMDRVPCPPQAEMTDTSSLLSYIASLLETRRNRAYLENHWSDEEMVEHYSP